MKMRHVTMHELTNNIYPEVVKAEYMAFLEHKARAEVRMEIEIRLAEMYMRSHGITHGDRVWVIHPDYKRLEWKERWVAIYEGVHKGPWSDSVFLHLYPITSKGKKAKRRKGLAINNLLAGVNKNERTIYRLDEVDGSVPG